MHAPSKRATRPAIDFLVGRLRIAGGSESSYVRKPSGISAPAATTKNRASNGIFGRICANANETETTVLTHATVSVRSLEILRAEPSSVKGSRRESGFHSSSLTCAPRVCQANERADARQDRNLQVLHEPIDRAPGDLAPEARLEAPFTVTSSRNGVKTRSCPVINKPLTVPLPELGFAKGWLPC